MSASSSRTRLINEPVRVTARAPARVNLIGEHTDYNSGYVLPMPIPQQTTVHLASRSDGLVQLTSLEQEGEPARYALGEEKPTKTWIDYIQGVTRALSTHDHVIGGFDATIESNVPMGAGLSSSAALEVAMLRALRSAFDLSLDDLEIARLGQEAEVDFVGVPVGIMDQMASSLGTQGSALLIDTRSLRTQEVRIPASLEVLVLASGVTHAHGTGDYRRRREECTRATQMLGVSSLRDLSLEDLKRMHRLEPVLARRVRHVLSENERVLRTVDALANEDVAELGALFAASHASMRNDFEISVPEIDLLVELGRSCEGVVAARLTGGGFGGSVVMLAERGKGVSAARNIAEQYAQKSGRDPTILLPIAGDEPHGV